MKSRRARLSLRSFLFVIITLVAFAHLARATSPQEYESERADTLWRENVDYTEYHEVERAGHRYLVYVRIHDGTESGWILHRKNCPCGWAGSDQKTEATP